MSVASDIPDKLDTLLAEAPSPECVDTGTMWRMSDTIFTPGADVLTTHGRGTVVDVRATPSGKFVFGVEDVDGEVRYFTEKALRLASS